MTATNNETKRLAYCVHVDHEYERISRMYAWEIPADMPRLHFGETLLVENGDSTALVFFIIERQVLSIQPIERKKVLAVSEEKIKLQYRKNFVDLLKVHKGIKSGLHTPEEFFGFYTEDRRRWEGWPRNWDIEDCDSIPERRVRRNRSKRRQESSWQWWREEENPKINADKRLRNAYTYRLAYCVYIGEEKISPFRSWVLPDGISPKTGDWLLVENGRGTTDSVCFVFEKQVTTNRKNKNMVVAIDDSKDCRWLGIEAKEIKKFQLGEYKPEWFRGTYLAAGWVPVKKVWPRPKSRARIYEIIGTPAKKWKRWGQEDLNHSLLKNTDAMFVRAGEADLFDEAISAYHLIKTARIKNVVKEGKRLGLTLRYKDVTGSYKSFLEKRYRVDQSVLDLCSIEGFTSVDEDFYMGGKKVHFRPIETLKPGEWNHYPEELYGYEWCANILKFATPGDLCRLPSLLPDDGKIYTLWVEINGDWCVFVPDSSKRKSWKRLPVLFNAFAKNISSPWNIDNQSAYYVRQNNWGIGMRSLYCGEIMIVYRHESNPCPLALQLSHEGFLNEIDKKRALKARDEYYSRLITPRS